jgi:hypothetical protein
MPARGAGGLVVDAATRRRSMNATLTPALADDTAPAPISATPDHPGTLRQRIAALAQMSGREDALGIRPGLIGTMLRRLELLRRMTERLGVDDRRDPLVGAVLREAEASCLTCTGARRCRAWLDAPDLDAAYREFCPNAGVFDLLPRKAA